MQGGTIVLAFAAVLAGAAPAAERAAIDAQTRRLERAFETKRFAAWNEILSSDFRGTTPDGKTYGKAAFIAGGKAEASRALAPISVDVINGRIDMRGKREARSDARELTCYGVKGRDRRLHRLCYRQHFVETWRKQGGSWKLTAVRDLPEQEFRIDGKRVSKAQLAKMVAR